MYRIRAAGAAPEGVAEGFTKIIDIAFGPDVRGYVLEHDADGIGAPGLEGRLVRLNADGSRSVPASTGLNQPGAVTSRASTL